LKAEFGMRKAEFGGGLVRRLVRRSFSGIGSRRRRREDGKWKAELGMRNREEGGSGFPAAISEEAGLRSG
jgi:hypothetical protein